MNKNWIIFLFLFLALSCNNEVDLLYEQPPIPIVYCVFNPTSSSFSLSLTRSVVGSENAMDLVSNPELLFYREAKVQMFAEDEDSIILSYDFHLSDIIKDSGIFPHKSGFAYYTTNYELNYDPFGNLYWSNKMIKKFRLLITIPESIDTIFAETELLKPDQILKPTIEGLKMDLAPPYSFYAQYFPRTDNSYYKELDFFIHYDELIGSTIYQRIDTLRLLSYIKDVNLDDLLEIEFDGVHFLNSVGAQLTPATDSVIWRKPRSFDFSLITVDKSFKDYIDTYENSGDGTSLIWSNMTGGVGLFAHYVSTTMRAYKFGIKTIDSLALSPRTKHLKFVRWE